MFKTFNAENISLLLSYRNILNAIIAYKLLVLGEKKNFSFEMLDGIKIMLMTCNEGIDT